MPPYLPPFPESPYVVLEDFKLLLEINIHLELLSNDINDIDGAILAVYDKNTLNRSKESMRERYDLLKLITLQNLQEIFPFIRHLDNESPAVLKLEKRIGSDELHIEVFFPKNQEENQSKQKSQKNNNKIEHQSSKKKSGIECEICQNFEKTLKSLQNSRILPENHPHNHDSMNNEEANPQESIEIKRNFDNNVRKVMKPLDNSLLPIKEALEQLMEKYQISLEEIFNICEKMTGEIQEVEEFLCADEQRKKELYWDDVDDEVLKKTQGKDDIRFKILLKYKGADRIKKRAAFIGVNLPFEF